MIFNLIGLRSGRRLVKHTYGDFQRGLIKGERPILNVGGTAHTLGNRESP
jgi:hypothetical protein